MAGRAPAPVRWWRLQPCSRNPLMLGTDRVEAVLVTLVVTLVLLLVPVCAAMGDGNFHLAAAAEPGAGRAGAAGPRGPARRPRDRSAGRTGGAEHRPRRLVLGAVDGRERTGQVPAPPQARAGDTVTVQVGPDGELLDPRGGTENAVLAIAAACGLWAALAGAGDLVINAVHRMLIRSRLRVWDQALRKFAEPPR